MVLEKGEHLAVVQRKHPGTAGRIENSRTHQGRARHGHYQRRLAT
ncbi:hypothetical protein [Streptomyces sp. NBC_00059]|nr:hypothetical protein [Streptomyces sp. NBC_00059]MCX5415524.1 hypothetical protein [Streptomyces sp. NBC_00059]